MTSKQAIKLLKRHGNDQEYVMDLYKIIENELDDVKHNYDAIKKMHDNSADYGAKIQSELNELKRDAVRFMVLLNKYLLDTQTTEEMHERWALEDKLSKVGKEE